MTGDSFTPLLTSIEDYGRLIEAASVAFFIADGNGIILDASKSTEKLLGLNREDIIGQHQTFFHPPDESGKYKRIFKQHIPLGEAFSARVVVQHSSGRKIPVEISSRILNLSGQRVNLGIFRDLTKWEAAYREAEEQRKRANQFFDVAGAILVVLNQQGEIHAINRSGSNLLGYSPDELIGKNWFDSFIPERRRSKMKGVFDTIIHGQVHELSTFQNLIVNRQGEERLIEWQNTYLKDENGKILYSLSSGQDLTERLRAEEELKKSEALFRAIAETAQDSIFIKDTDSRYTFVNPATERLFDCPASDLTGKCPEEIFDEESARIVRQVDAPAFRGEISDEIQDLPIMGETRTFHTIQVPLRNEAGDVTHICGIVRDVTDEKRYATLLKESEEQYRVLVENMQDGVFLLQGERLLFANQAFASMLGYTVDEIKQLSFRDVIAPEDLVLVQDRYHRRQAGEKVPPEYELRFLHRDGETRVHVNMTVALIQHRGKVASLGTIKNVTETQRTREELKRSEERYRTLYAGSGEGILIADIETRKFTHANPAICRMLGYSEKELLSLSVDDIHPEKALPEVISEFEAQARGEKLLASHLPCLRKDGEIIYVNISIRKMIIEGNPCNVGFFTDITHVMRAEKKLRESEERFRTLFENSLIGIYRSTPEGELIMANPTLIEMLGYDSFEELAEKNVAEHGYQDPSIRNKFQEIMDREGLVRGFEAVWLKKDGSSLYIRESASASRDSSGKIIFYEGTVENITETVTTRAALEESETRFQTIFDSEPECIRILDRKGTILQINKAGLAIMEVETTEEVVGKNVLTLIKDPYKEDFKNMLAAVFDGKFQKLEFEIVGRKGTHRWLESHSVPLKAPDGTVTSCLSVSRDVTDHKKAGEAIRESEEKYRSLVEQASDAIYIVNRDGKIVDVNSSACSMLGYSLEELQGRSFQSLIPESDLKLQPMKLKELLQGKSLIIERTLLRKDGTEIPLEISAKGLPDGTVQGIARDISERKRAERVIIESESRLRKQNKTLLELTRNKDLASGNLESFLWRITEASAATLSLERVKICFIDENSSTATCADSYTHSRLEHTSGDTVPLSEFPFRFSLRHRDKTQSVTDTLTDPRTEDLAESYYRPKGITSILNAQIWLGGKVIGILTHEHTGPQRSWEFDEQRFASSMADLASLAVESSNRRLSEEALKESEERYALASRGTNDGLWEWDLKAGTFYYSPRWKSMLGYSEEEIGNGSEEWFKRIFPEDLSALKATLDAHFEGEEPHFEHEHRIYHKDGTLRWVLTRGMAARDSEDVPIRMAGSQTDISDRKQAEQQILHDAFHDGLTNLPNRALFTDRLNQLIERKKRNPGYQFAVMLLDLDRFKVINESLGHLTGDKLLISVAERILFCVRPGDTVARLGGDEFAILLDDLEDPGEATRSTEKLLDSFSTPFALGEQEIFTTASIGITTSHSGRERPEAYLRDSETAMYKAKKSQGRGSFATFDEGMHAKALSLLKLETGLRQALERNEFNLYYQPILNLKTMKINGFEALIRWNHPTRGILPPVEFLKIADNSGQMSSIDCWVIEEACRQLKNWRDAQRNGSQLQMNVNISNEQLYREDFQEFISEMLKNYDLPPGVLGIEITESAIMENLEQVTAVLKGLKSIGIKIFVDDFGTGYSSLSYLHQFPLDTLKIDKSFIDEIRENGNHSEIVRTIVSLGHNLGLTVTAEGVENRAQLEVLNSLGCNYAQGFLIAQPLQPEEAKELIFKKLDL